jgi:simple sugar transport system permease protein
VVIGGALLTGGYGSVIGAALGALIFGVVQQGLFFAGVESSLFRVFLGVILLVCGDPEHLHPPHDHGRTLR